MIEGRERERERERERGKMKRKREERRENTRAGISSRITNKTARPGKGKGGKREANPDRDDLSISCDLFYTLS